MTSTPQATYRARWLILIASIVLALFIAWGVRHIYQLVAGIEVNGFNLTIIWLFTFLSLAWTNVMASLERPKTADPNFQFLLDDLRVVVLVPVYNEDKPLLEACLSSLINQSRRPDYIYIVDDGSNINYDDVRRSMRTFARGKVKFRWTRTENKGKRHAQSVGIRQSPTADIYMTVDSDTVLDHQAIEEGLKPFLDSKVAAVAGICLPINQDHNIFTRFTSLWEISWQLLDRSAQSAISSVTVNSGILAFYRAVIVRPYLDAYLSETFFGRKVTFSDDSLLTTYAMLKGKTIQQPTSVAFSASPEKIGHYIRRYIRWMRGSFIRSWWRFKYLPLTRFIWWLHMSRWLQTAVSLVATLYIVRYSMISNHRLWPYLIGTIILISYCQSLRYFMITRSDMTIRSQIFNYTLAPLAAIWALTVLRLVRWYAYATCLKTGWGTRQTGAEVGLRVVQQKVDCYN